MPPMNLLKLLYLSRASKLPLRGSFRSEAEGVFIVGCGRSGTTILRKILQAHSAFSSGPETHMFTKFGWLERTTNKALRPYDIDWIDRNCTLFDVIPDKILRLRTGSSCLAEFGDRFFAEFLISGGATRWVEKTPAHVNQITFIATHFPKAKFIHLLRDPRDTICSLRTHPKWKVIHGERVPKNTDRPIPDCLDRWIHDVSSGVTMGRPLGDQRYTEIRYEDILDDPKPRLEKLFAFLGVEWEEAVLDFHTQKDDLGGTHPRASKPLDKSRVARWKSELSEAQVALIKRRAGALAAKVGYELA